MDFRPLVLYHDSCKDGFCAAWAYRQAYPHADFVGVQHGDPVPLGRAQGRDVVLLDFCFKRQGMIALFNASKSLLVLDHHITAAEEMGKVAVTDPQRIAVILGIPVENVSTETRVRDFAQEFGGVIRFDMTKSGAGLTWDYVNRDQPRPWLVDYVEDRDLWNNALLNTRPLNAYISTIEFDFDVWDRLGLNPQPDDEFIATFGQAAMAKTFQYVREVSKNAVRINFEGYDVPIVNAPQYDISELLNFLAKDEPFAMGWWQLANGRIKYSLRTKGKDGLDVALLAKKYGGGGHPSAAGFEADTPIHMNLG